MSVLWVTSFNKPLWDASGDVFMAAWRKSNPEGDLLVTVEGPYEENWLSDGIARWNCGRFICIDNDPTLTKFLADNAHVIPEHLGGTLTKDACCQCPNGDDLDPRVIHNDGCHWSWWNRNASKWFRKLVSLNLVEWDKYRYVVWVDGDCEFVRTISEPELARVFQGHDVFYLKGPRKVPEGGIVGYNTHRGKKLFEKVLDQYMSGKYRGLPRWDDSYVIWQELRMSMGEVSARDVAANTPGQRGHVVAQSVIGKYVAHHKGKHGRIMRLHG